MTTETLEELRARLLREEGVQQMIQMRAYEIYLMRGCKPGGEAHDWFHAEAEVLAFLLADEPTRNDDQSEAASVHPAASAPSAPPVARKRKPRTGEKSAEAKTTAQKKPATKRASAKKSAGAKSGATRTRKSKPEES